MESTMTNIYQVQVFFDARHKQFIFTGDMEYSEYGPYLKVARGIHAIVFTLTTIPARHCTAVASFTENPILWSNTDTVLSSTSDDSRCSLVVTSLTDNVHAYGFQVKVMYDGSLHESDDPTIINDPPVSPPGG